MPGFVSRRTKRKVVLPTMQISRVCAPDAPLAVSRAIPAADGTTLTYHYQPVSDGPVSDQTGFNLVPLVLAKDGSLWEPAVAYVTWIAFKDSDSRT
jgi:hypothetical protein